ncbi:AMP-binding protein [Treponema vincentii]|uniref:AMP-binding protein n=1 Tax=Treponema vincentii TaxID=69710 RepID=UPI0035F55D26
MDILRYAEEDPQRVLAITDNGETVHYSEIDTAAAVFSKEAAHQLVFLLCSNSRGTLLGYLGCLKAGAVPLLLDAHIAPDLLQHLIKTYRPTFYYIPHDVPEETKKILPMNKTVTAIADSLLLQSDTKGPELFQDLALLLTTSGSTGSPKLVRLTYRNICENARSIAEYLHITDKERPITMLPMSYSYGMSIINSHALMGATIILSGHDILTAAFWERVKRENVSSLVGIPYTYQIFSRLRLTEMELPALKTLTQAGGKLPYELHKKFGEWSLNTGRRFFVMYGQTEAAPRMAYLPPDKTLEKCGSMGIAVPGGALKLIDETGTEITTPDTVGELVYHGSNVAMGYAECAEDLSKGDEWHGTLHTGDMAKQDSDGYFFIVGRKKRFIKVFGNRVNLDDTERLLSAAFPDAEFACIGQDDLLCIYTTLEAEERRRAVSEYLAQTTRLPAKVFHIFFIDAIPKNTAGKKLYSQLKIR